MLEQGVDIILHGRSEQKLEAASQQLANQFGAERIHALQADLSDASETEALAKAVIETNDSLDILINNAGILNSPAPLTKYGIDVRLLVNTISPYILCRRLLPIIPSSGRIINLASAAQAPVELNALRTDVGLDTMQAYSQSKLALIMWSEQLANELRDGPTVIAVNPGSLLASKMVKEGFGVEGKDMNIGADILVELSVDDQHAAHSGDYFDNDAGDYGPPHPSAKDPELAQKIVQTMEQTWADISSSD